MKSAVRHASNSAEQQAAEATVLSLVQLKAGCSLSEELISFAEGVSVKVDGINREHRVLCEIYSRVGALKGSQPDKLAADMLKLIFVERSLGGAWRKLICLVDEEAAKTLRGKSWLAAVARSTGFEVVVVTLPGNIREGLMRAQERQHMVNRHEG